MKSTLQSWTYIRRQLFVFIIHYSLQEIYTLQNNLFKLAVIPQNVLGERCIYTVHTYAKHCRQQLANMLTSILTLQCIDAVGWVAGRASGFSGAK